MYKLTGRIEGTAPLLYGRMVTDLEGGTSQRKLNVEEHVALAWRRTWKDERGLYIPKINFKNSMVMGCASGGVKEGRKGFGQYIKATVFLEDDLLLDKPEADGLLEVVGRIPPRTGAAAIIRYPMINLPWSARFSLVVTDDRRSVENIRAAVEEAGLLVGIGPWRPEYGRFVLTEWSGKLATRGDLNGSGATR